MTFAPASPSPPTASTTSTPSQCNEAAARRKSVEAHRPIPANRFPRLYASCPAGLERASDAEIWQYATDNGFVIVSRDSDFQERVLIAGHPPQIVWLKIPNRSKTVVLNILLGHRTEIEQALLQENRACVEISLRRAQ